MSSHSLVPCTFHHTHMAQVRALSALHSRSSTCHPCVRPLHLELPFLLLSFLPVLLPLLLLPPQRRAAAGPQHEDHGKPALLRYKRLKGTYDVLYLPTVERRFPNWESLFVHRDKGLFLSVYVDDIKLAGKKQNIDPMWKVLNKEVDLGEPTSFLDHVYLECTQRQCEISKDIVDNYRTMFESRISAGATEKLPCLENIRISSWSYDMEGHAKKCVERYCELANKTTPHLYKVPIPCIDDHHFKEKK